MKTPLRLLIVPVLLLFAVAALPGALHAQLPKIFVASFGNDANDGSRNAPKRNFQAAHNAVAVGGEIVALDTAGYGALSITKSVSVVVPPGVTGFVTVTGFTAVGVSINAGAGASVSLRGLIIEGSGSNGLGYGISVASVGNLSVEDCTVRNFAGGLAMTPSNEARLYAQNCTLRGCSTGFLLQANAAVGVFAILTACRIEENSIAGVSAYFNNPDGFVDLTLGDCVISGNNVGIRAQSPGSGNEGDLATLVRVDNCRITANATGVLSVSNGQILSRGNNTLAGNNTGNGFADSYSPQ